MQAVPLHILGLGVSTIDELLVLDHHPLPNDKQPVLSRTRQCGGLTGSALVAASRLGCRCGHVVTLGQGELSAFLRREMEREGVKLFGPDDESEAEPYFSMILTQRDTGERTILWDNAFARPPRIGPVEREAALRAKCLFVDHVYADTQLELVSEAREAGVPVVGDFERTTPGSRELMDMTDHVILPLGYARVLLGDGITAKEAVCELAAVRGRDLACVTDGLNGCWYALGSSPEVVSHQPAMPVTRVVDTTGCGDVFHGAYAAGIVHGWPAAERIRRSSAAAALKTRHQGAQAGAPYLEELLEFLESQENE